MRYIKRDKVYSFINVFGLSVGMSAFILVSLMLQYMFSYDTFHKNYRRVYRVQQELQDENRTEWIHTVYPVARELKRTIPEIEEAAVIREIWSEHLTSGNDVVIREVNGFFVDPGILNILTFRLIEGDPATALDNPGSVVISKTLAQKLFPGEDAFGKIIKGSLTRSLIVSGIMEDYPVNSHIRPSYLVSFSTLHHISARDYEGYENDWENNAYSNYVLLKNNTNPVLVDSKIRDLLDEHVEHNDKKLYLKPVNETSYNSTRESKHNTPIPYFAAISLFILVLACINYVNLTTARSGFRKKEIGIRKVVGGSRFSLIRQFIGESVFISLPAIILAFLLARAFLPLFNSYLPVTLELNIVKNWPFLLVLTITFLFIGMLAGIYPAFYLSSLQPVTVIKGSAVSGRSTRTGRGFLRKILVSVQFIISITLILSTVFVSRQVHFMIHKDLGYNKSNLLYCRIEANDSKSHFTELRSRLLKNPGIIDASVSANVPARGAWWRDINWEGCREDQKRHVLFNMTDYHFMDTFQMRMAGGRYFSEAFSTDNTACLINETLASELGWENPVGKKLLDNKYTVIGVIKDFHPFSVYNKIPPYMMVLHDGKLSRDNSYCVRIAPDRISQSVSYVTSTLKAFFPEAVFEVQHFDEDFDQEMMMVWNIVRGLFGFFSALTIIIALIGLLGLVSFSTRYRIKEMGIRKVLGALETGLYFLVAKEFLILLGIAIVLAAPAAYLFLVTLPGAYKYQVKTLDFLLPLLSIVAATVLVTLRQVFSIIRTNPSDSLRCE